MSPPAKPGVCLGESSRHSPEVQSADLEAEEITDARQNILTGSHYLRWLLDYFEQNLELSIAAYNAGEGAVMQAGRKVPQILETQRYVPKVLALYHQLQETP